MINSTYILNKFKTKNTILHKIKQYSPHSSHMSKKSSSLAEWIVIC